MIPRDWTRGRWTPLAEIETGDLVLLHPHDILEYRATKNPDGSVTCVPEIQGKPNWAGREVVKFKQLWTLKC